jgi:hypothetical protein
MNEAQTSELFMKGFKSRLSASHAADHIGIRAQEFYRNFIQPTGLSKAQMAAVGSQLRRAVTLEDAEKKCKNFLEHQMEKLEKREGKGAKPISWRKDAGKGEAKKPLGEIVITWIDHKIYLPDKTTPSLPLLQRFWHQIETLYHYHAVTGQTTAISKEICP